MIRTSAIIADGTYPCGTAILQGSSREVFYKAKEAGYDCIQLTIRDTEDYDEEELRALMKETGLSISAMATGRVYTVDGLSMGAEDEDNRILCVERLCRLADMSDRLSVEDPTASGGLRKPALVIGAVRGLLKDASTKEIYLDQFDRSMKEVVAWCEKIGVPVILEADDHLEADTYLHPEETLAYVKKIGSPVLHMYIDVMHLYNEGLDPAQMIRKYAAQSFSIDIAGENRVAPMESQMDFREIIAAIRDSGFDGVLTFEMPPSPPENNAELSLAYIKKLMKEAGLV
ncbi:MAG: sugar phosphate isomerase/epimerase [Lachnospiraceae bacterium]|nr:sugar phosphate isomerase/epimerase [Lachnospiraceae bacterium]